MNRKEQLTLSFFILIILSLILSAFFANPVTDILIGLLQLGLTIAGFVMSIILIRKKKLAFGVTFLILYSILLLLFVAAFLIGFALGVMESASVTGAISTVF